MKEPTAEIGRTFLEGRVDCLVPEGFGLVRLVDGTLLTPGVLPGERVLVAETARRRGARFGRLVKVLSPSAERAAVDCPHRPDCGGCDFLQARPEAALALKAEAALRGIVRLTGLAPELIESPRHERYRRRAVLHLDQSAAGPETGFYDAERRLVNVAGCRLLSPALAALLPGLHRWAAGLKAVAPRAEIHFLEGLNGSGILVTVQPAGRTDFCFGRKNRLPELDPVIIADLPALEETLRPLAEAPLAVFFKARARGPVRALHRGSLQRVVAAHWPEWNLTLPAGPGGFTQVNPEVNHRLVRALVEEARPLAPGRALDLYSGQGNIAWPLHQNGFEVTAVEESETGAAPAGVPGTAGFRQIHDSVEKTLPRLVDRGERFTLVVLDPPRAGAKGLAPQVAALNPKMIVYISCRPAALERDLPALMSLGYRGRSLLALDMFPRTSQVEALLTLTR